MLFFIFCDSTQHFMKNMLLLLFISNEKLTWHIQQHYQNKVYTKYRNSCSVLQSKTDVL